MSALLIALTGRAGAGKDTAGEILRAGLEWAGLRATRQAFADPIRDMLTAIVPAQHMTQRELKELPIPGLGPSYRHLAQTLGTEWGRQTQHPDFWVWVAAQRLQDFESESRARSRRCACVFTDARFPNELTWVRNRGGLVVRIHRPDAAPVREHASETAADDMVADFELRNDGTLAQLRDAIGRLLPEIMVRWECQRSARTPLVAVAGSAA